MTDMTDKLTDRKAMRFVSRVEKIYKNVTFHLPPEAVDFLVSVIPYLVIITGVLCILVGPLALLGTLAALFLLNPLVIMSAIANAIFLLIMGVLSVLAFKPLQERKIKGWVLLFWMEMTSAGIAMFNLLTQGVGSFLYSLVGLVIGLYILFELKRKYS